MTPGSQTCGGTLVDEYTIVTAAHCLYSKVASLIQRMDDNQFEVYVAAFNTSFLRKNVSPSFPTVKVSIKNIIEV